jgi:hypothetical protein
LASDDRGRTDVAAGFLADGASQPAFADPAGPTRAGSSRASIQPHELLEQGAIETSRNMRPLTPPLRYAIGPGGFRA